jgi:hypothetical protein
VDAPDTAHRAVEIVADLLARSGTGQVRSTDGTAGELYQAVADQLRRSGPGGYAFDRLTQAPQDPAAHQSARDALAAALAADPEHLGWVQQRVALVEQRWAQESAAYPPVGVPAPPPRRRHAGLIGGLVAACLAVLLVLGLGVIYLATRATFTDLLVGHWTCNDEIGGEHVGAFTVDINKRTFVLRDTENSGNVLTGTWHIKGARLVITPDVSADTAFHGNVTVDGVPHGSSDGGHTFDGGTDRGHEDVHTTVANSGKTITVRVNDEVVTCDKKK